NAGELKVIDLLVLLADTVMDDLKKPSGKIGLVAVGKMSAMTQIHGQHPITRLEEREIDRHIRAAPTVWLDIGVFGAEKLFGAVDGQLLDRVHVLTTTVPATARVAFRVFVSQHRALRLQHRRAGKILAGDQFDVFLLPLALGTNRI